MSRLVPDATRRAVIELIGAEAREADWEHLTQADKTAMLSRWVTRGDVGGVLRPLLGSDGEVRVWVKEVALKRSLHGRGPTASSVISAALGPAAAPADSTVGDKPSHCLALSEGESVYVCWDRSANAKHLFWAALNALEGEMSPLRAVVAFVETTADATPDDRRQTLERIARRCGLTVTWIET